MPRRAPIPECSEKDRKSLEELARSRTEEARIVERAKIILKCLVGERVHKIATDLKVQCVKSEQPKIIVKYHHVI